jgi:hypothetical protein
MEKLTIAEAFAAIDSKVNEMMDSLDTLLNNPNVSENTKRTQKFQRSTAIHNMLILKTVFSNVMTPENEDKGINTIGLTGDLEKWFNSMITPSSERKNAPIELPKEGDSYLPFLEAHPNWNMQKLKTALAKNGLTCNMGKIVRL